MTIYGYARVSTDGQSVAAQETQLRAAGCAKVYAEKVSGKGTGGRVELAKALKRLAEGDVLIVTRRSRAILRRGRCDHQSPGSFPASSWREAAQMSNVIPFPQPEPAPYDEVLFREYGVKVEPLNQYQQGYIALMSLELGRSYEEALCRFWEAGGI
jgi:hypothetical protein